MIEVEQLMVMIHGEFNPNEVRANPEDEWQFKDEMLGLISNEQGQSIRVYNGTKPVPRYRQLKMWLLLQKQMSTEA